MAHPRPLPSSAAALLFSLALAGCANGGLKGNVFHGDGFAFRFTPPPSEWQVLEHSHAALAYRDDQRGATMMINARCGLDGEDVPLLALTNHLFLQFTERDIKKQQVLPFDGREAMHTVLTAKLDGVPMSYDVWVMKKDGCVYDMLYMAPVGTFERGRDAFRALVAGFSTVQADGD